MSTWVSELPGSTCILTCISIISGPIRTDLDSKNNLQNQKQKLLNLLQSSSLRSFSCGDPAGARTPDNRLKRQVLYQLSYRVIYYMKTWGEKPRALRPLPNQNEGFDLERRSNGGNEPCRLRRGERSEVCSDDVAGMAGLEPAMRESKSRALTAWLHPIIKWSRAEAEASALPPVLGWAKGLEPSTLGTTIRCSTN